MEMGFDEMKEVLVMNYPGEDRPELREVYDFCMVLLEEQKDRGKISDGYHTFEELYYHRMILFLVLCRSFKKKAWKSWLHSDGSMFTDYFIVGINTPDGQFTYHFHKKYFVFFHVREVERAPEWDGHESCDVKRLLSLNGR